MNVSYVRTYLVVKEQLGWVESVHNVLQYNAGECVCVGKDLVKAGRGKGVADGLDHLLE